MANSIAEPQWRFGDSAVFVRVFGHPDVERRSPTISYLGFTSGLTASFYITAVKRGYRVRLNGADHQWGKDPPKEVVG